MRDRLTRWIARRILLPVSASSEELESEIRRLRAENATLREREAQHRSAIAAMSEGVVVQDGAAAIVEGNEAAERILGLTLDQMSGRSSLDPRWRAVHEDGSPFPGDTHPAIVTLRTGEACRNVVMGVHKPDGTLTWIAINTEPIPGVGPGAPRVVCTFNDITDYKKALADQHASEERLNFALSAANMGAWQWDVGAASLAWSDTVEDVFGIPRGSFDGRFDSYMALIHPDDRAQVSAAIEAALAAPGRDTFYVRHRIVVGREERWLDGHGRVFRDAEGRAVRMAGVAVDVTEARRLELQVRQTQRLEAVGRLAGGIAHDFNNVLTVILSVVDLALRSHRAPDGDLEMIRDAANRAARLTGQLLSFARRRSLGPSTFDVGELVQTLRRLLGHLVGERIELVVDVRPGGWRVHADEGQLEQVLMNLVANASDAIEGTGRIEISVGPPRAGGDEVAFAVSDTGVGMSPEVVEHVFEPFFSTKPGGTGLGLATAYGIVKQHQGRIEIDSAPGNGTRVEVRLPRARAATKAADAGTRAPVARGSETLLVVEDDALVRRVAERALTAQGYRVLTARDGVEALEVAHAHLAELGLVLTDAAMPRMGGAELAGRVRALRADLPVLIVSGYDPEAKTDLPWLDKPYTPEELTGRVRELLDRAKGHTA